MAHFGDRSGRKRMFTLSVFLMAIPTLLIGLLPTYVTLGYAAPLALLVLRILQGAAVGGEVPGAWTFVAEHVPGSPRRVCVRHADVGPHGRHRARLADGDVDQPHVDRRPRCRHSRGAFRSSSAACSDFSRCSCVACSPKRRCSKRCERRQALVQGLPLRAVLAGHGRAVVLSMLLTWVLTAGIVVVILMTPGLIQKSFGISAVDASTANTLRDDRTFDRLHRVRSSCRSFRRRAHADARLRSAARGNLCALRRRRARCAISRYSLCGRRFLVSASSA